MRPEQLSIIVGVCVPVFVILLLVLAVVLWKMRSRREEERRTSTGLPEKMRITPYNLPSPPKIFQPASSFVETSPPAPATPPMASTSQPTGDGGAPHYKTWRTAAAAKAFGDSGYYGDRDSYGERSIRLQARSAQSTTNDMTDLISLLNSGRVDTSLHPPAHELGGKAMRPISVDSTPTIVASHSGSKESDLLKAGHKMVPSMDKGMEEGYGSESSVPSVLRKPKYNPITGAPMIPSIYFGQPFELVESEDERAGTTPGVPSRKPSQRVQSSLLSRSKTQNSTASRSMVNQTLMEAPMEEDLGRLVRTTSSCSRIHVTRINQPLKLRVECLLCEYARSRARARDGNQEERCKP
ncbi:hypothetical protein FRC17_003944 [Serendipita sp. 399]|nr:hypothetical protein FRC17_003944 [Serendipita sp. 399]